MDCCRHLGSGRRVGCVRFHDRRRRELGPSLTPPRQLVFPYIPASGFHTRGSLCLPPQIQKNLSVSLVCLDEFDCVGTHSEQDAVGHCSKRLFRAAWHRADLLNSSSAQFLSVSPERWSRRQLNLSSPCFPCLPKAGFPAARCRKPLGMSRLVTYAHRRACSGSPVHSTTLSIARSYLRPIPRLPSA